MAQPKPEVNRSQIIRDLLTQNPKLLIPEVVNMLAERGIKVSKNLVHVVKVKMKAKKLKEKREKAAAAAASNSATNAKGDAPSKSSAIRTVLKETPKMTAGEVVSTLAAKGISVTDSLVYFVKGKMKGQRARKKKAGQVVAQVVTATAPAAGDTVKTILNVKNWAAEVGGMKKLKALVEALSD